MSTGLSLGLRGWLGVLAAATGSCGGDEPIAIEIAAPKISSLDPTRDERAARVRLTDVASGRTLALEPFRAGDERIVFHDLPVGLRGELGLEIVDGGGALLGLGRTADAVLSSGEGSVVGGSRIRFDVRKPFAYVGGTRGVSIVDTTWTPPPVDPPGGPGHVTAVAVMDQGRRLLVGVDGAPPRLLVIRTFDHEIDRQIDVSSTVRRIVADPAGRSIVLVQDTGVRRLTFPLMDVVDPLVPGDPIAIATPGTTLAAFDPRGTLYVVTDAARPEACVSGPGPSRFQRRNPDEPLAAGPAPALSGGPVSDLAVNPRNGNPVFAHPCDGRVVEMDATTGEVHTLIDGIAAVSEIVATRDDVIAFASNAGADGRLRLVVRRASNPVEGAMGWPTDHFELGQLNDPGSEVVYSAEVPAEAAAIFGVALSPDGKRFVMPVRLHYRTSNDDLCPLSDFVWGILIADLPGGVVSWQVTRQQLVSSCATPQPLPGPPWDATSVAALLGGS